MVTFSSDLQQKSIQKMRIAGFSRVALQKKRRSKCSLRMPPMNTLDFTMMLRNPVSLPMIVTLFCFLIGFFGLDYSLELSSPSPPPPNNFNFSDSKAKTLAVNPSPCVSQKATAIFKTRVNQQKPSYSKWNTLNTIHTENYTVAMITTQLLILVICQPKIWQVLTSAGMGR